MKVEIMSKIRVKCECGIENKASIVMVCAVKGTGVSNENSVISRFVKTFLE